MPSLSAGTRMVCSTIYPTGLYKYSRRIVALLSSRFCGAVLLMRCSSLVVCSDMLRVESASPRDCTPSGDAACAHWLYIVTPPTPLTYRSKTDCISASPIRLCDKDRCLRCMSSPQITFALMRQTRGWAVARGRSLGSRLMGVALHLLFEPHPVLPRKHNYRRSRWESKARD
jgi:hypothetical protein